MTFSSIGRVVSFYVHAKKCIIASGFAEEILVQEMTSFASLTEKVFLRETAWVILSAGMSERVIRAKFPELAEAFFHFDSSDAITKHSRQCYERAMKIFCHEGKVEAIIGAAESVARQGFSDLIARLASDPFPTLLEFRYVGPITVRHLAKNIGIVTAKGDRHLSRLASWAGFSDAFGLCSAISEYIGERPDVVDTVLWRYATLHDTKQLPTLDA